MLAFPDNRLIVENDIPWVLTLAHERYRAFDPGKVLVWLVESMRNPGALCIRNDHAFLICHTTVSAWWPKEPACHVIFICARPFHVWDAVRLARQSVLWARGKGCTDWWISSETDSRIDAIAKRVGAQPAVMRYRLKLHGSN